VTERESIWQYGLRHIIETAEAVLSMGIFLRSIDKETEVEGAVNLLRSADILVGSGALIRQNGEPSYGAITLYRDSQVERALLVLARSGIKASA
jgi:hypothetical protein